MQSIWIPQTHCGQIKILLFPVVLILDASNCSNICLYLNVASFFHRAILIEQSNFSKTKDEEQMDKIVFC